MERNVSLRDAAVQEIQLELIRRSKFNAVDGERVVATLLRHRSLWTATLLDRPGQSPPYGSALLLIDGLIKLRDLPGNLWNADVLYVLTPSHDVALELARHIEADNWGHDEVLVYDDDDEIGAAIGATGEGFGLLTAWWD